MAELPRSGVPWSYPGVPTCDVQDEKVETCEVCNDLKGAVKVNLGPDAWQILYPDGRLALAPDLKVSVQFRDDPGIWGSCVLNAGGSLLLSRDFGGFSRDADNFFQREAQAAAFESHLREKRKLEIDRQLHEEVNRAVLKRQLCAIISIAAATAALLVAMVLCTLWALDLVNGSADLSAGKNTEWIESGGNSTEGLSLSFDWTQDHPPLAALSGTFALLCCCACYGACGFSAATGASDEAAELQDSIQCVQPALQGYRGAGAVIKDSIDEEALKQGICEWRQFSGPCCVCAILLVSAICIGEMAVNFTLKGYGWPILIFVSFVTILCSWCLCGLTGELCSLMFEKLGREEWRIKGKRAVKFIALWPVMLLAKCCGFDGTISFLVQPTKKSLERVVFTTHEHTIVFEGNVLPASNTVCSWPGKYESAWDSLVAGSRQDQISAAVVFLPEGSQHFGLHDPIPAKDSEDLQGDCWCTPLYGEAKPWGCRWWSKWIANIDLAVQQHCTLEVYYFNGKVGKGKVKDFTSAGMEHMRREQIFSKKIEFEKSDAFQSALQEGLQHLSKEKGPDASSPYSRELHRLFLAWLPDEERHFLEESEGLGNSQKAEVAWLERQGYHYVEKEVHELRGSSPKAIGRQSQ